MCLPNAEIIAQKFGYQRENYGVGNQQKALNQFDIAVYYPTNWRVSYIPHSAKFPKFIRYGGLVPIAPEYFQRNFMGVYPIGQQPLINETKPHERLRYS
jgi:hypothetical protein